MPVPEAAPVAAQPGHGTGGHRRLRLSLPHTAASGALFAVEVAIALFAHDGFVRPYFGDVLVVLLVHQSVLAVLDLPSSATAAGTLVFAYAVEGAQYAGVGDLLDGHPIVQTVVGTTFQAGDLIAYAVGALIAAIVGGGKLWRTAAAQHG